MIRREAEVDELCERCGGMHVRNAAEFLHWRRLFLFVRVCACEECGCRSAGRRILAQEGTTNSGVSGW
ncbi:MAG: hypothetical protein M0031_03940 [Thermaerobacter sp.]|nr:hypothetical protein [Thermaerobacter sp.]